MLAGFLGWISLLFEPLADVYIPPIQPQERLRLEHRPWHQIITGVYGRPPLWKIHDRHGDVSWSFHRDDVTQPLPHDVHKCLYAHANDATEVKYMNNGTSVGGVYSDLAVVMNHTPDNPATDKFFTFTLCRRNDVLWNAHTLEPLPGDLLAVGTTGQRAWDGILVYNASAANPLMANPPILQNITGLRAIHGLIWDEQGQMLWAAGTDAAADGSDPVPAYGTIVGYPWDRETGLLVKDDRYVYKLPEAKRIEAEWGKGYSWWAGLHDLVPIPNQRKFLVSEDRGLHAFDIETGQYTEHYENVTEKYLHGFEVTTEGRHGYTDGEWEELPQSDLKSFNIAPDGSFIYVQSLWTKFRGFHTSLVINGKRRKINIGDEIYRSRWFGNLDGWPKP
ncbi:hypothetical protein N7522_010599 [Penicillium canescens]|uniref:Uncharacterized protein n=1 Tax=Penicillium canescens TaxID=5083 RepID=A0AAD6IJU0_PENCN|nr:uncharacterized protein N7446_006195 [Penicillium canescens]KAJ5990392.1 hypothetical protein N7522_010599 [Penicillium canescens]KAJ6051563.1 hypothetical protein N7460_002097 [Penicillium canescens]KAJ6062075.1 hypothetical protein N7446_006195 [Penicillium canescens]KAJ6065326.1 hypothetical protein N7444_000979 [Penicillium canescens]